MWSSSYYDGDAWFMSDSLAFYLSTNTFRNPVFDEQFASSDDCQGSSGPEVKGRLGKLRSGLGARCSQLCDNLAFSLRSKLFVLELNFKRSLRRMRGFAKRHGLKLIPAPLDGRAGQGKQVAGCQASMQQTPWMHGALGSASRRDERKFWRKMGDSRASLGIQKEKILSRLEQVVQAKRNSEQKAHLRLNHLQLIRQGQAQLSGSSKGGRKGTADSSSSSSSSSSSNRGSNVCSDSNNNNVIDKKSAPKEDPTVGMHFGKLAGRCATNVSGNCKGASPASPLLPGGPVERQTCESGWKMKVSLTLAGISTTASAQWNVDLQSAIYMAP